jgi:hypothetical protein
MSPRRRKQRRSDVYITQGLIPPVRCPRCRTVCICGTGFGSSGPEVPTPGCMVLCGECSTFLVLGDDLTLRLATDAEIAALDPDVKKIATDFVQHEAMRETKH